MIISTRKSKVQGVFLALIFILGLSGISWGQEFWLRAETLTKTMPDASVITMWGFAQCPDNTYIGCTAATVPGPRLTVPAGDTVLTIHLRNNLTGLFVEPVSIVIPGLAPTTAMTPVKVSGRVRSFSPETPADNATTVTYSWTMKPGTYLYESGYHPAVQVQMGLYGAATSNAVDGLAPQAYGPSTAYAAEALLLFSEIDLLLHGDVAAGTYGTTGLTSTIDYEPRYFLINGEPFTPAALHIPAGISGQNLLLRFLSAGIKHRVPTIYGMKVSLVAEDGNLYPYPKEQYSLLLSPGKTMDALAIARGGEYPVYDRRLGLTNDTATSGGMLTYLSVTPDFTVPTGSVVINGGALTTNSRNVTLTLSATDVNAVTNMRFSWDNITWLGWVAYATTANATIPFGSNGTNTIYVQFRDFDGNISTDLISDSIDFVDVTLPTGSVVINGGAATTSNLAVTLTLSAADLDNAVTNMQFSWDNITWLGWEAYATVRGISIPAGPGGTKTIYVQFRDAVGNVSTTYSDSITYVAIPPLNITTTTLPSGLVGTVYSTTTLTVTGGSGAKTWSISAGALPGGLNLSAAGVISGTPTAAGTFNFTVRVADVSGAATRPLSITVTAAVPVAPTNLAAVINSGPLRITLTWNDASNNETSFVIWRSDDGGAFTQIGTLTRTAGQITATGGTPTFSNTNNAVAPLVAGHRYRYYVTAVNAVGASSPSNTVLINYSVPVAPSSLAGTAVRLPLSDPLRSTEDRATLNWTDNSTNEANFQIQRATNSGFTTNLTSVTLGSNVTTFSQNVSRTQDFYYRVRTTNLIGNSGWSNVVLVITP